MSQFHAITAKSFEHREVQALRRLIVDWHADKWTGKDDRAFAIMWRTGEFDRLEATCEEFVNRC